MVHGASGLSGAEAQLDGDIDFSGSETDGYFLWVRGPLEDVYENDDTSGNASVISTDGVVQHHSHHGGGTGDVDWTKFTLPFSSGKSLSKTDVILGDDSGGNELNLTITLYGPDSATQYISHDSDNDGWRQVNFWLG